MFTLSSGYEWARERASSRNWGVWIKGVTCTNMQPDRSGHNGTDPGILNWRSLPPNIAHDKFTMGCGDRSVSVLTPFLTVHIVLGRSVRLLPAMSDLMRASACVTMLGFRKCSKVPRI